MSLHFHKSFVNSNTAFLIEYSILTKNRIKSYQNKSYWKLFRSNEYKNLGFGLIIYDSLQNDI